MQSSYTSKMVESVGWLLNLEKKCTAKEIYKLLLIAQMSSVKACIIIRVKLECVHV